MVALTRFLLRTTGLVAFGLANIQATAYIRAEDQSWVQETGAGYKQEAWTEMITKYVCPKHRNIVLFIEDSNFIGFIVLSERPMTCSECNKPYYKAECVELDAGGGDENEG